MTFAPTAEQLYIEELFRTGDPLLVRAGHQLAEWLHQLALDAATVRSVA